MRRIILAAIPKKCARFSQRTPRCGMRRRYASLTTRRRLQRVAGPLAAEVAGGEAAEFALDDLHEPLLGLG